MRIIILTVDHIYSNVVVKALIKEFKDDISAIIVAQIPPPSHSSIMQTITKILQISGVYYSLIQLIKLNLYRVISFIYTLFSINFYNKFYKFKSLAHKNDIPLKNINNINEKRSVDYILKVKPDIIVSVLFNQIIAKNIIQIPKKGVINIHPGYLPDYKGISPIFWSLVNNELYAGVSVHFIDEGIDSGAIIARKKVKILPKDTEDSLYWKTIKQGIPLLISAIHQVKNNNVTKTKNFGGKYFSFPTKKSIHQFRRENKKFFRLRDYILSK